MGRPPLVHRTTSPAAPCSHAPMGRPPLVHRTTDPGRPTGPWLQRNSLKLPCAPVDGRALLLTRSNSSRSGRRSWESRGCPRLGVGFQPVGPEIWPGAGLRGAFLAWFSACKTPACIDPSRSGRGAGAVACGRGRNRRLHAAFWAQKGPVRLFGRPNFETIN